MVKVVISTNYEQKMKECIFFRSIEGCSAGTREVFEKNWWCSNFDLAKIDRLQICAVNAKR